MRLQKFKNLFTFLIIAASMMEEAGSDAIGKDFKGGELGHGATAHTFILPASLRYLDGSSQYEPCVLITDVKTTVLTKGSLDQRAQTHYQYDWNEAFFDSTRRLRTRTFGDSVTVSVYARYRAAVINTSASYNHTNRFRYIGANRWLQTYALTPKAKALADKAYSLYLKARGEPKSTQKYREFQRLAGEFYRLCGDRFIYQLNLGSEFYYSLGINFKDKRQLMDYYVKVEGRIGGIKKSKDFKIAYDFHLTDSIVHLEAHQEGGDKSKWQDFSKALSEGRCYISAFKFEETEGFKQEVKDQLSRCYRLWDEVVEYMNESYKNQISGINSLVVVDHEMTTYESAGLVEFPIDIPQEQKDHYQQLNRLIEAYKKLEMLEVFAVQFIDRINEKSMQDRDWANQLEKFKKAHAEIQTKKQGVLQSIKSCHAGAECAPVPSSIHNLENILKT